MTRSRKLALAFVFLWFAIGGVAHFVVADAFLTAVPPSLPYRIEAVYISGAFELLGALGLLIAGLRRRAGIGLFVLTLLVTPANVYMWQHPELFPMVSEGFLLARLGLQVVLLAVILWSTQPQARYLFR
jgi:uncharacterized membrane protein